MTVEDGVILKPSMDKEKFSDNLLLGDLKIINCVFEGLIRSFLSSQNSLNSVFLLTRTIMSNHQH